METSVTGSHGSASRARIRCLRFEFVLRSVWKYRGKAAYTDGFKILICSRLRIYARLCLMKTEVTFFREAGASHANAFGQRGRSYRARKI